MIKDRCRQHYTRSRIGIEGKINAINHETNVRVGMVGGRMAGAREQEVGLREDGGGSVESHLRHGVVRVIKVEALLLAAVIAWPRVCDRCKHTQGINIVIPIRTPTYTAS